MIRYSRKAALAAFDASYRLILCPDGCVYCSLAVKGVDHVPPLRFVQASGPDRFLYPSCVMCNLTLGPLPDVCLKRRAAFLIAALRAEWKEKAAGRADRWLLKAIEKRGRLIRDRLAAGDIARLCQCSRCRAGSKGAPVGLSGLKVGPDARRS